MATKLPPQASTSAQAEAHPGRPVFFGRAS